MKAFIGPTTKTSTSTSIKVYALHSKGSLVELRTSETPPKRKICRLSMQSEDLESSRRKTFSQVIYEGGKHLLFTTRTKLYYYTGVGIKYGKVTTFPPEVEKRILDIVLRGNKL